MEVAVGAVEVAAAGAAEAEVAVGAVEVVEVAAAGDLHDLEVAEPLEQLRLHRRPRQISVLNI